jgi:4-hydroxymandelate oxidase
VILAPTAVNRLAHPDGDLAVARAAGACGSLLVVSTNASATIEEIARDASGPLWFQLYVHRDRAFTADLVHRVEANRYSALMLTVDTPRLGRRERDLRNRFALPAGVMTVNLEGLEAIPTSGHQRRSYHHEVANQFDPSLTWEAIAWLRSRTRLPVLVKGLLSPDDAALAVAAGVAGIVVSNHGGRQLDGAIATIDALPDIADVVARRVPILLDGGVRRGTDVVKALALGASAVMIGRPYLWGLAAAGEAGVCRVLDLLQAETESAMALCGCPTVQAIKRPLVVRR